MGKKLFDFVIGNPPYQIESENISSKNGQKPRKNVFHFLQMAADDLTQEKSVLVYPGGRWIHQSGKGLKQFGKELINDLTLSHVIFYSNSREVFPAVDIPDGISIVVKDFKKSTPGFKYTYIENGVITSLQVDNPGDSLMPLNPNDINMISKIDTFVKKYNLSYLHDAILPRSLFSIESDFIESNLDKVRLYEDDEYDTTNEIKLFTNDKAGSAGRSKWFIAPKDIIKTNREYISQWQVVVSSAHAGGQDGRSNQLAIIDNHSAFGRARVALRSFLTKDEALNFFNYVSSKVIKYAFLMTDEALGSLAKKVPDLVDYSSNNSIIDFSGDIDLQLFDLIGFEETEIEYLNSVLENAWR